MRRPAAAVAAADTVAADSAAATWAALAALIWVAVLVAAIWVALAEVTWRPWAEIALAVALTTMAPVARITGHTPCRIPAITERQTEPDVAAGGFHRRAHAENWPSASSPG